MGLPPVLKAGSSGMRELRNENFKLTLSKNVSKGWHRFHQSPNRS